MIVLMFAMLAMFPPLAGIWVLLFTIVKLLSGGAV